MHKRLKTVLLRRLEVDFLAAETGFKSGDAVPGVFGVFAASYSKEIVILAAPFLSVVDGLPLEEIGGHHFAVGVARSAVVVNGGVLKESGDEAGDYLAVVFGEVEGC